MNSSIDGELDRLKSFILDTKNKKIVIKILEKILKIKFTDFKFQEVKTLKRISEYDFSVLNFVGNIEEREFEFYIKIIKGGEIKKSVFCCWSLLQEEYEMFLKETKDSLKIDNKLDKVSIKEEVGEEYKNSVQVIFKGNICYNFEVNFIELERFVEKFEPKLIRKFKNLNLASEDILLIMVKDFDKINK